MRSVCPEGDGSCVKNAFFLIWSEDCIFCYKWHGKRFWYQWYCLWAVIYKEYIWCIRALNLEWKENTIIQVNTRYTRPLNEFWLRSLLIFRELKLKSFNVWAVQHRTSSFATKKQKGQQILVKIAFYYHELSGGAHKIWGYQWKKCWSMQFSLKKSGLL